MAVLTSLFAGVSGLTAFGNGLSVVSDNIANMNTKAFKGGEVSFADLIASGQGRRQIGRGVFLSNIATNFEQGSFESTGSVLDLAVEGDGFFVMEDPLGAQFYTRNGAFNVNKNGLVENPEGLLLQGIQATATGSLVGQPSGNIDLSPTLSPAQVTSTVNLVANLDSRVTIPSTFSTANPSGTSNFSTSITVYDSLGNGHLVPVYFRKNAALAAGNQWQYFALVNAADATSGVVTQAATGTIQFDLNGRLSANTLGAPDFDFSGGATQSQSIALNFGSTTGGGGSGLDGLTQFGTESTVLTQTQNGFSSGAITSFSVDEDGIITGLFTNGESRVLAQLELANFSNPQGLSKVGGTSFVLSSDSGQPILSTPNSGGTGRILANSLELSNVDLAQQFVKMIEFQRGFQANSRVISTTDDLLSELVNIVR